MFEERHERMLQQVLQRTSRIETRLVGLAIAMNVDVTDGKNRVQLLDAEHLLVDVTGVDVSFGDVLAFCRRSGINGIVTVMCGETLIGNVKTPEGP